MKRLTSAACIALAEGGPEWAPATAKRHARGPWRGPDDDEFFFDGNFDDYPGVGFGDGPRGDSGSGSSDSTGSDSDSDSSDGTGNGSGSDSSDSTGDGPGPGSGGSGGGGGGAFGPQRGGLPVDVERAFRVRNAHGVLAAVTFIGVFPLGAILMRVAKTRVWLHGFVQLLALAGYVAAAGLGIWLALYVRVPGPDGTVNLVSFVVALPMTPPPPQKLPTPTPGGLLPCRLRERGNIRHG